MVEEKAKAAEEAREEARARARLARKSKAMARGRGQNLEGAGRKLIQPSIRTFGRGLYSGQHQHQARVGIMSQQWDDDWEPPINNPSPPAYRWSNDLRETAHAWGVHENQTRRAELLESVYGRMASLMINTGISMRQLINEMKDKM